MTFTDEQRTMLAAPLDPRHVSSRTQAGRSLSYIEAWHCIAEANRIFGFDGWSRETVEMIRVSEYEREIGKDKAKGWGVSYIAKVRVTVGGIVREGTGSGHGIDRDPGLAHESAAKEAESDALKRALMTFGNPFGLALYDKSKANVGRSDEPPPRTVQPMDEPISPAQLARLVQLKDDAGADVAKLCTHYGVESLASLRQSQFDKVVRALKTKIAQRTKEAA